MKQQHLLLRLAVLLAAMMCALGAAAAEAYACFTPSNTTLTFYYDNYRSSRTGTTYNASNPKDKTYAHIDGGTSNPGYFTAKNASQRGDINGDGLVNVADVTALIQIVLNSTPADLLVADLSGDGQVNVADVTALIQLVLNN